MSDVKEGPQLVLTCHGCDWLKTTSIGTDFDPMFAGICDHPQAAKLPDISLGKGYKTCALCPDWCPVNQKEDRNGCACS